MMLHGPAPLVRASTGTVLSTVAPIPVTLPTENSANLLRFNSGPVAQKDVMGMTMGMIRRVFFRDA